MIAAIAGAPATVAAWRAHAVTRDDVFQVPTRTGDVPARFYRPAGGARRTVLLMPGVHRDGINEARLVGLAEDLAATGFGVLTIAAPDLQKFKITPQVTDMIEDAVIGASAQPQYAPDGKVGMPGISFSGGLSIVAAGRPSIRDHVAFGLSFGGHGDLARVMHYLCSGQVLGDLERAKQSSAVVGADHVDVHTPHDYGVAVVLLSLADRVVPADQVAALSRGIDGILLASPLWNSSAVIVFPAPQHLSTPAPQHLSTSAPSPAVCRSATSARGERQRRAACRWCRDRPHRPRV